MFVQTLACLNDNYAYLILDQAQHLAAVVDPSEATPVLHALEQHQVQLKAIVCTHHHWDHVGGIQELIHHYPNVEVYGSWYDRNRIEGLNRPLRESDCFNIGSIRIRVHEVPGHTLGALAYFIECTENESWVFTGDTLFLAGCGRLFEGTAEQMYHSLNHVLARLPLHTNIACGHEYTLTNLRFAQQVEPNNLNIKTRIDVVKKLRLQNQFSVPGTLAKELQTNPFLRVNEPTVRAYVGLDASTSAVDVFAKLRAEKDRF